MLEILKMQPLIKDISLSDTNIVRFMLNGIPAKAADYHHSICVGLVFIEKKMISDAVIRYITLMLVALEDTQDFALQLNDGYWWLWCRHTINDRDSVEDSRRKLGVRLEQIHAVNQHFNSLVTTMSSSGLRSSSQYKNSVSKAIL
ncbi:hypothetical protein B4900_07310 [Yersinia rohdei]|nr:hypothetical protein B4900_07310 [Yersinia rohdei]